ncbi:pyrroloquinoline quinone biosynthesis peptide chaperone PqqD [Paracoccus contaminans]|uniref:Pyrroloquinoline quinone biosynthesis protein PqqD n=1 Tax=Paracoccus contaminans TaxID=1945662 RepID=A0A1W6CWQ8_9RHOB|nr:pyrroloquinoline quinone biosynthesis peptide chaperone PqqD [Paracoccus contaminans]ARJ69294.1 pyrroloquinoline quinone biosynthesis protein PqqD [Paracoccus contaminans]
MSAPAAPALPAAARPLLPRGVRLHQDRVRQMPVLLGPETALMLDGIGAAILAELDGIRDIAAISACLSVRYGAAVEEVQPDVIAFLSDMAARRLVAVA